MLHVLSLAVLASPLTGQILQTAWAQDTSHAQPELPKQLLTIVSHDGKSHEFHVEIAKTPEQQTVGLMFRPSVPADGGMLFVTAREQESQFWMRNTIAPLDMLFIGGDGKIHHIAENAVPQSLAVIDSRGPVRATLELAAGTTERLDLRVGDKVTCAALGTAE
jgi:uncharacterized membrane protein (UPF0127 family)